MNIDRKKLVTLLRIGRFCRRHVFMVACLAFGVYLLFGSDYSLMNILKLQAQEAQLRDEIEEYQEMTEDFQRRIDEVNVDNEKLERYAREKMHMKAENEDLYLIDE